MEKVGVTGYNGYIGQALVKAGAIPLVCDVTNASDVEREIREKGPSQVLHLAAKSGVEFCERNPDEAWFVNVVGTRNVAEVCGRNKIPSATLSTYQIWKGGLFEKHKETSKIIEARNRYGLLKLASEVVALDYGMNIIRTSYVFDEFRLSDRLDMILSYKNVLVEPSFLFRSFIYLDHFVDLLGTYFVNFNRMPNTLHLAGSKTVSWYYFMRTFCKVFEQPLKMVSPRYTENRDEYPRPWNGGLDTSLSAKLGLMQYDYVIGLMAMRRRMEGFWTPKKNKDAK